MVLHHALRTTFLSYLVEGVVEIMVEGGGADNAASSRYPPCTENEHETTRSRLGVKEASFLLTRFSVACFEGEYWMHA